MAEAKRRPGRPPKNIGLAPLGKVVNGPALRSLQSPPAKSKEPVLPPAHQNETPGNGRLGVFGTAGSIDGGRSESTPVLSTVSNLQGTETPTLETLEEPLAAIFKRLLQETAAPGFQESGVRMRNAEVLARTLMNRALEGNQFAIEVVLDRAEGKAVRGSPVAQVDTQLEEQIGRAEVAALNELTKTKDE